MILRLRNIAGVGILLLFIFETSGAGAQENGSAGKAAARQDTVKKARPAGPLDEAVSSLFKTHRFEQTAISPDGKKVAWVETLLGKNGAPGGNTAIYLMGLKSNEGPARVTTGESTTREDIEYAPHAEGSVAWSSDSTKLAFLSDAVKHGQLQLYVKDLADHGSIR
ncbi:MAG: TolB family protein, partial [Candidatus Acidiferrum sp.]